jgi:hypothetical protein
MMWCTILVSTVGNSFVTRDAFAQEQQQLQTDQAFTIPYNSPWSNNLLTVSANGAHHDNVHLQQSFTDSKNHDLNQQYVGNKVVGPDRFRFVTSYWTVPDTSLGVDVGTFANNTFLSAASLPPNQKLEVDTNEGPSTLAVVLQYEGVVDLAGVTGALKLPPGFKAQYPLTDDRTDFERPHLSQSRNCSLLLGSSTTNYKSSSTGPWLTSLALP